MSNSSLTRRAFLAGAAALSAAAGLGAIGCAPVPSQQQTASPNPVEQSGNDQPEKESALTDNAAQHPIGAYDPRFDLGTGSVVLNNGVTMPILGLGTYLLSSAQAEASVTAALDAGMRLIDTARIYGNEDGVGRAIAKSSVPRDQIFLTTKMWTADFRNGPAAIDGSLQKLGQDYVDLMLLHHEAANDEDAYRAMENAVKDGKIRCIGISNFYESGFERMVGNVDIVPAVLQNETQPFFQERAVKEVLAPVGTVLESWFPLCGKADCHALFANPVIAEVAANHGVVPAQAVIRWHLQSGNICIPGSSNPDHIREDADVFGFSLTPDEMAAIDALDRDERFASY